MYNSYKSVKTYIIRQPNQIIIVIDVVQHYSSSVLTNPNLIIAGNESLMSTIGGQNLYVCIQVFQECLWSVSTTWLVPYQELVCVCVCVCLCVCVEVYAVGVVSSPPWPSDIQLSVGGQVSSGVILLMLGPLIPFISML